MAKVGQDIDARNAGWTFEGIAENFDEQKVDADVRRPS